VVAVDVGDVRRECERLEELMRRALASDEPAVEEEGSWRAVTFYLDLPALPRWAPMAEMRGGELALLLGPELAIRVP
jgi:hypothetical protein